ncbi:MAG: hypothetical protein OEY85_11200, partial [Rhodospirillales bacterium]|nr:hypothetical protein [Rhodospirillales bacterium]
GKRLEIQTIKGKLGGQNLWKTCGLNARNYRQGVKKKGFLIGDIGRHQTWIQNVSSRTLPD